jgi:hypothetical protein
MIRVIAFNSTLISEKDKIIKDFSSVQNSLKSISNDVNDLTTNEKLEVVARTRSADCLNISTKTMEQIGIDELELARTCSALRIIPDALPSSLNEEATMASFNQLMVWADPSIEIESIGSADTTVPAFSGSDSTTSSSNSNSSSSETTGSKGGVLNGIGISTTIKGQTENVYNILDTIEKSVRNYDIVSASITFTGGGKDDSGNTVESGIELNGVFRGYYSTPVNIEMKSKKLCADNKSEKCTGRKKQK